MSGKENLRPPEIIEESQKFEKEKKPEARLKLPDTAVKYLKDYLESPRGLGTDIEVDLMTLSELELPHSKHDRLLKRVLANVFSTFKEDILERGKKENLGKDAIEIFFSPIKEKTKIEADLKKYRFEKKQQSGELFKINENKFLSKEVRKEKKAPYETRLLEISQLIKSSEEKIKATDVLSHFLPGYEKDLANFKDKTVNFTPELKANFDCDWLAKNLEAKLAKLKKANPF